MKTPLQQLSRFCVKACVTAALLAPGLASAASLVVDWGGDYVPGGQGQSNPAMFQGTYLDGGLVAANTYLTGIPFHDDPNGTPLSPDPAHPYAGTSDTFYGGVMTLSNTATHDPLDDELRVQNKGTNDVVEITLQHGGHDHDLHAAFLWQRPFLTGNNPIVFDADSYVTLFLCDCASAGLDGAEIRLLVRDDGGQYWVSQFAQTNLSNNTLYTWSAGNQGFSGVNDGQWALWNPYAAYPDTVDPTTQPAGSDLRFDQGSATWATKNFSAISAVGFLYDQDNFRQSAGFSFNSFEVYATAIPEPTTLAGSLLALLSAVFARIRSRNRPQFVAHR